MPGDLVSVIDYVYRRGDVHDEHTRWSPATPAIVLGYSRDERGRGIVVDLFLIDGFYFTHSANVTKL